MRSPRASSGLWRAAAALVGLLQAGCRAPERKTSAESWDCLCVLEPNDAEVETEACGLTASEASDVARACVEAASGVGVRFCDCTENATAFCEAGECVIR